MANIFKSKYTGEQIDEILDKANNVTDIQANNGEPTTADLTTLKIGNVNYKIPEQSGGGGGGDTPSVDTSNLRGFLAANSDGGLELSDLCFYLYNNGMTWRDFINSPFNINGGHIDGSTVYLTQNGVLSGATPTSIINNRLYTYGHAGGSN